MNFTAKARFKSTSQQNKHQLSVSVSVFYEKLELDEEPNITKKVPYKQKTPLINPQNMWMVQEQA